MATLDPEQTLASLCDSVGLDIRLKRGLARLGYERPTLVQSKCLPLALTEGRDLMVRAKTGSGKTIAYALPLLQKILQRRGTPDTVGAIVLVPTRELCAQVREVLQGLSYYCDEVISIAMLSVGQSRGEKTKQDLQWQEAMLKEKPGIIVATPGGLLRHIRNGDLSLKESVETLVVDEADLVLSFGYKDDITEVVRALPRIFQGFLMSATLTPEVNSLKQIMLNSPAILKLEDKKLNDTKLKQFYYEIPRVDKNLVTYVFLKLGLLKGKGLLFVNSTNAGYALKLFLEQFHIRSTCLNAELPFLSRMNIIEQFNVGNSDLLIATDASADVPSAEDDDDSVDEILDDEKSPKAPATSTGDADYGVSRGLDFRNVSFVLNFDFPPNATSYAHRVGRTARAGASGVALSFVDAKSATQKECLKEVQDDQPALSLSAASTKDLQAAPRESDNGQGQSLRPEDEKQPAPLVFDLKEIDGFRYRVEDMIRTVTKKRVRQVRLEEIRQEIVNSERLQNHFKRNPEELKLLQHNRVCTDSNSLLTHLKHVPHYLLPKGMQPVTRKKRNFKRSHARAMRREGKNGKDPLRTFDEGMEQDGGENDPFAEFMDDDGADDDDDEKPTKKQRQEEGSRLFSSHHLPGKKDREKKRKKNRPRKHRAKQGLGL